MRRPKKPRLRDRPPHDEARSIHPRGPYGDRLGITPDGSRLFVCNRFNHDVSVLSLPEGKEIGRVKVAREPVGVAAAPDGKTVFVIDLLPDGPADRDGSAALVTAIDAKRLTTIGIRLPNGSSSVRGICTSPDGKHVFVTHVLSRNGLPATQLERGWMNTNALSILDARQKKLIGTILLDDVDLARPTLGRRLLAGRHDTLRRARRYA